MILWSEIASITGGNIISTYYNNPIAHLLLDSRKVISAETALFFAVKGERHDGHLYLEELYQKGVRNFIIENESFQLHKKDVNQILVKSSVDALQQLAASHRKKFNIPVVGITGSNGKTIVKEWLSQLLSRHKHIVKNPKSFNSQIGVPLSVWQINSSHELGIFEAGISMPGEMQKLEKIIAPTIGIFTNIGPAHDENFQSSIEKWTEKSNLFSDADVIIYNRENLPSIQFKSTAKTLFDWSWNKGAKVFAEKIFTKDITYIRIHFNEQSFDCTVPFQDPASLENCMHCIAFLLWYGLSFKEIQDGIKSLHPIGMRLELKEGINQCSLIDDSYSNDLMSLRIAVQFLQQQQHRTKKSIILSDIPDHTQEEEKNYLQASEIINSIALHKLVLIGNSIGRFAHFFKNAETFVSTDAYIQHLKKHNEFSNEIILLKGARKFEFEKITHVLQQRVHETRLEINLDSLTHNLNFFRSKLNPGTKIMVMVKALAYGSGSFEVAQWLQYHRVDYLAVAYADEGVVLRENGITIPIMVMNPTPDSFEKIFQYRLEPEIYNKKILHELIQAIENTHESVKIHLKLDTGMHRLGFEKSDTEHLIEQLKKHPSVGIASIFTHLAGADEEQFLPFTLEQLGNYANIYESITQKLSVKPLRHALNSAGIIRYPEWQMDMVRLGIGLYGYESNEMMQNQLHTVGTLKTVISQIKKISAGETVGYSRKGKTEQDIVTATIAIGYADGYNRKFSNGVGKVLVNGHLCPVIGNVCMDMCMINITGVQAKEGDDVIVFGDQPSIIDLARASGTIPYEILTNVSERVKRVFFTE